MAFKPILTAFLASAELAPEEQEDVRTTLLEFGKLSGDDRHRSRPSLLEMVLLSIFGDNASVQSSSTYDLL